MLMFLAVDIALDNTEIEGLWVCDRELCFQTTNEQRQHKRRVSYWESSIHSNSTRVAPFTSAFNQFEPSHKN